MNTIEQWEVILRAMSLEDQRKIGMRVLGDVVHYPIKSSRTPYYEEDAQQIFNAMCAWARIMRKAEC
jgi:vacuolar-type H+-ATPase subunit C/Vma6